MSFKRINEYFNTIKEGTLGEKIINEYDLIINKKSKLKKQDRDFLKTFVEKICADKK